VPATRLALRSADSESDAPSSSSYACTPKLRRGRAEASGERRASGWDFGTERGAMEDLAHRLAALLGVLAAEHAGSPAWPGAASSAGTKP
jgi:hypothetical protein